MKFQLDYNFDWETRILKMWAYTRYDEYNKFSDTYEAVSKMHFSFSIDVLTKDNNEVYNTIYVVMQAAINGFNDLVHYNYKYDVPIEENLTILEAFKKVLKTLNIYCSYAYRLKGRPYASFAGMLNHYSKVVRDILVAPDIVYKVKFDIQLINANLNDYPYRTHYFIINSDQRTMADKIIIEMNDIDNKIRSSGIYTPNEYMVAMDMGYRKLFKYLKEIDAKPLTTETIPDNPYDDYQKFLEAKEKVGEALGIETNVTEGVIH